jgi:hypothetical protein
MPRSNARLGCLVYLLLFALLGVGAEYFGKAPSLDADEGPGRIAAAGIVWLILYFVIFGMIEIVRATRRRTRSEPRGFPVEPQGPGEIAPADGAGRRGR